MVISRVIIGVTPFRALICLLITYLLSPLPLQVGGVVSNKGLDIKDSSSYLPSSHLLRPPNLTGAWGSGLC